VGPRAALSQVLIIGALLLLVAVGFGVGMGNRVLGQVAGREPVVPTPVPIPTPSAIPGDPGNWAAWKHISVMAVATDPAFPDPRIPPEPEVRSTLKPPPRPKPTPSPTPFQEPSEGYTSPPMPLPLVSHTPEGPGGESEPTRQPGRGPTPPVPAPSPNP